MNNIDELKKLDQQIQQKEKKIAEWKIQQEMDAMERNGFYDDPERYEKNELKKELLEKYKVFETKTDKKTGLEVRTGKINIQKLSEMIIHEFDFHFITLEEKNKPIWYFNGKHYKNNGEIKIGQILLEYIGSFFTKHILTEVITYIQHYNIKTRLDFNPPLNLINLENGIFDVENEKLYPHTPEHLFNYVLPITYNKDAKCPKYEKFLTEITNKDGKPRQMIYDTLQEYFGFCFYRDYIFKKYLVMDGENDNGKTTLMNIWIKVLGENNITSIPLQELNDKPFRKDKLYGMHGNFSDELPNKGMKYGGVIKEITGKSPIWADIKNHKDGVWFINFAKPFFACNDLPETRDTGNAFFSRQIQVTLYNKYLPKDSPEIDDIKCFIRNIGIVDECTTTEEKSGIFNHAMIGLKRLMKNKRFTDDTTTEEKRKTWIKKSDPITAYYLEELEETNKDWCIKVKDLEEKIIDYCKDNQINSRITVNAITRKLSEQDITKKRVTIEGSLKWVYLGIQHITDTTINNYIGKTVDNQRQEVFI